MTKNDKDLRENMSHGINFTLLITSFNWFFSVYIYFKRNISILHKSILMSVLFDNPLDTYTLNEYKEYSK